MEDDDEEDEDNNDDDSNDPEWRIDDDRDSANGKRKSKASDEEMDLVNGGDELSRGHGSSGSGNNKRTSSKSVIRKGGRKCRDKTPSHTLNMKHRKKNALGLKLSSRR